MHLCYVLLSPAFGMQQYTADLANGAAARGDARVDVLTVRTTPGNRFAPSINLQPIANVRGTGLKLGNFDFGELSRFYRAIVEAQPDVVHFTGPHIWNPILLAWLKRAHIPTIHTIHDLDPHSGTSYGRLLYVWNDSIKRLADHILVHSQMYRSRLIAQGLPPERVTYAPLLHLFLNYDAEKAIQQQLNDQPSIASADSAPFALFFARLEPYKGIDVLIEAMHLLDGTSPMRAIIAGKGDIERMTSNSLPANIEVRNHLIEDREAADLFCRCSIVVLPYIDATQSALIAAAYFFGKPVIVTRTGALPEYVVDGETGWIIEPRDARALADRLQAAASNGARLTQMGQSGRGWYLAQRMIERYTLHRMYEQADRARTLVHGKTQHTRGNQYVNDR